MQTIKQKIKLRLDELEILMRKNTHINDVDLIIEKVDNVAKFWSVLQEDEKDFLQAIRYVCRTKERWQ